MSDPGSGDRLQGIGEGIAAGGRGVVSCGDIWHLHGTVLPDTEPRDLWIADGLIHTEPVAGAQTIARDVWLMPGLVDAHCHIGLGPNGAVSSETARAQAETDRDAGVLLVRDAGAPVDTHWVDACPDLPRIVRAGRHIARPLRYLRHYATEIDPQDLPDEVATQAARGDGWVKLVGDWIDRPLGDLAPLWSAGVAAQAIDRAHRAGARVTAHCFAEQSVQELVRAGIDGIEHGTGLDDDTIGLMAAHGTALVPTMINLANFPRYAASGEAKFPTYAAHMRALYDRRLDTISKAREAGVPIFAGTDAGGTILHGQIAREIEELAALGGAEFALGAASWRAREWLGLPARINEGTPADLVVYRADPRVDVRVTEHPGMVILRGRVVFVAETA